MRKLLFIASVAIFALAACKGKGDGASTSSSDSTTHVASSQVAYINIDSLVSAYNMYKDLKTDYETKVKKVDGELTAKGRSFERDVNDFQDKVQKGLVTRAQAATMEESLQRKQQSFMQHRDKVMQEMAEEEQVMLNRIHYGIVDYLKEFNSDNRYGMIISTTASGPILNADPSLDITKAVLVGLNAKYDKEKKSAKKDSAEDKESTTLIPEARK